MANDRLASGLKIAVLDPYEEPWCLRSEVGMKAERTDAAGIEVVVQ